MIFDHKGKLVQTEAIVAYDNLLRAMALLSFLDADSLAWFHSRMRELQKEKPSYEAVTLGNLTTSIKAIQVKLVEKATRFNQLEVE